MALPALRVTQSEQIRLARVTHCRPTIKPEPGRVSPAKSDPLTVGSSDHFDNVAQKRLPLGGELQLALNLIPAHTWYANSSRGVTFVNQRCSDYIGLSKDHFPNFLSDLF